MISIDRRCRPWRVRRVPMGPSRGLGLVVAGFATLLFASVPRTGPVAAHETDHGYDEALETGQIVPLDQLMERIRRDFPGRILRVEVEHESHGGPSAWVYEVKMLTPDGHVLKLEFDAGSMELLELKGRHDERRPQDDG